jgi:hypothetical protein
MQKKMPAKTTRFRPSSTGECEARLWVFTCPRESSLTTTLHRHIGSPLHHSMRLYGTCGGDMAIS